MLPPLHPAPPTLRPLAAALALPLSAAACAPRVTSGPGAPNPAAPRPEAAVLTGTVTYRPRIALPPDATVRVRLEDVSLADAPAPVLAEQTIAAEGRQVPFPFALRYSPAAAEPRRSYAVRAEIRDGAGALLWTTTRRYAVLTGDALNAGPVEVVVEPVTAARPGPLTGVRWRLVAFERAGTAVPLPPGEPLSLAFEDGNRFNGEAGCNRFGGPYGAGMDGVALGLPILTLAACAPPSEGEAYLRALGGARVDDARADTLVLALRGGGRLVYAAGTDAWDDARARGAAFRAVGGAPGWTLEIVPGGWIELVLDYGARRVVTPDPGATTEGARTVYRAVTESASLRVVIDARPCEDAVSGAPYPSTTEKSRSARRRCAGAAGRCRGRPSPRSAGRITLRPYVDEHRARCYPGVSAIPHSAPRYPVSSPSRRGGSAGSRRGAARRTGAA